MLDKLNSVLETIQRVKSWKTIIKYILLSILFFFLSSPEIISKAFNIVVSKCFPRRFQMVAVEYHEIEELVSDFDQRFGTSTGLGIYDADNDVKIAYLESYRGYLWDEINLRKGSTITIKKHDYFLNGKCAYISPEKDLYFDNEFHLLFCEIVADTMLVFSFAEKSKNIDTDQVLKSFSTLSNKIERKMIGL